MKLETNPIEVAELAQKREKENCRFRTFLKQVDLDGDLIDAVVHRYYEEIAGQIDCCACANCCVEISPVLQKKDVKRLAVGLKLTVDEVIERFLIRDEDGDMIFRNSPCPFLVENRCSIYEHRPEDCRSFPHLHKEEFTSRLLQAVENCFVCPIVFNVFERLKETFWEEDKCLIVEAPC